MPNGTKARGGEFRVGEPRPVLAPDAYYEGDNGRVLHGRCCGASAAYTGRDLSGKRVRCLSAADVAAFLAAVADLGVAEACESCRRAAVPGGAVRA